MASLVTPYYYYYYYYCSTTTTTTIIIIMEAVVVVTVIHLHRSRSSWKRFCSYVNYYMCSRRWRLRPLAIRGGAIIPNRSEYIKCSSARHYTAAYTAMQLHALQALYEVRQPGNNIGNCIEFLNV